MFATVNELITIYTASEGVEHLKAAYYFFYLLMKVKASVNSCPYGINSFSGLCGDVCKIQREGGERSIVATFLFKKKKCRGGSQKGFGNIVFLRGSKVK